MREAYKISHKKNENSTNLSILAISHCMVGRKSGIRFQRSDIMPAGTP